MAHILQEVQVPSSLYQHTLKTRFEVLCKPIGLKEIPPEVTAGEESHIHIAMLDKDNVLGGCILTPLETSGLFKLRQMYVIESCQGANLGNEIMMFAEKVALKYGAKRITMNARMYAKNFYGRHGYTPKGEAFTEVGISHIKMEKVLETV